MFSRLAKTLSTCLGHANMFVFSFFLILIWLGAGPFFNYDNSWQLVINSATSIVTFLMVFIIQNTQNRDTIALHLKLDEIIRSLGGAHNELLKVEELSDEELDAFLKRYETLAAKVKKRIKNGESNVGSPDIKMDV